MKVLLVLLRTLFRLCSCAPHSCCCLKKNIHTGRNNIHLHFNHGRTISVILASEETKHYYWLKFIVNFPFKIGSIIKMLFLALLLANELCDLACLSHAVAYWQIQLHSKALKLLVFPSLLYLMAYYKKASKSVLNIGNVYTVIFDSKHLNLV